MQYSLMPEKPLTKAQRKEKVRQQRAEIRRAEVTRLTRRKFLRNLSIGFGGISLTALATTSAISFIRNFTDESTPLPPLNPSDYEFKNISQSAPNLPPKPSYSNFPAINRLDLEHMWDSAKQPTALDTTQKLNSLPSHVSPLFVDTPDGKSGRGTGMMIDQSGLFLTAKHVLAGFDNKPISAGIIFHPGLNQSLRVSQVIYSPDGDLALAYAPTGLKRSRAQGVQISPDEINDEELLRQYGILMQGKQVWLAQMEGNVLSQDFKPFPRYSFKGLRSVYGMVPFGGSSGGPIVSLKNGSVVAVESGLIANKQGFENNRNKYLGATIAPVTDMEAVIRTQQIHNL